MRHTQRTVALAIAASLALSGCRADDDQPTDDRADQQADDDVDATDADGRDPDADDGSPADVDADDGGDASPLGEVTIDQTQTHPNGVELTIRAIRVEQNAIFLDIEAFNGAPFDILLTPFELASIVDDTGKRYRYEPPEDNDALLIEPSGTLEGSIAFIGRVGTDASSVTVQFNHDQDGEPRSPADRDNADFSDAPSFEFADLPLPGA
ncbi:hypothetical protein [Nitriliruptor alkaliphilus]|uniref:hypothetical protein n=1 Tax=Nitriliruptor alkaliphilus TaxID=427918 RepID=UPI0012ED0C5A|nr:hypothetical protein [Nitriliruptor alkaliphilus]